MQDLLKKCAATALSSKLIARQKDFFSEMVVDAVRHLGDRLPLNMIGIKKVQGGSLEVGLGWEGSRFVKCSYNCLLSLPKLVLIAHQ